MGVAACSFGGEDTDTSGDAVTASGDVSQVLKSTLVLETGCMAVKVGPKQLLLAARCVVGNDKIAEGKSVGFVLASGTTVLASAPKDAGADAASKDAGAPATLQKITIAGVDVHPSFTSKCTNADKPCGFDTLAASDAKDIAVLTLSSDLDAIITIPIDLDAVGQSDPLLAVSSGCATFSAKAGTATTTKTIAVPTKLVNHDGSPYLKAPNLVSRLAAGYVVTPGAAWRATDAHLCATNIGAPLFRGTQAAVAGITSNFTAYDMNAPVPVTIHHTRVDISSKVGPWLEDLGVQTIRTCSTAEGGCKKNGYDGGAPKGEHTVTTEATAPTTTGDAGVRNADAGDAGDDGDASLPDQGEQTSLSSSDSDSDETTLGSGSDDSTDPIVATTKKKSAAAGGCSTTPGSSPAGGLVGLLGVALALGALRRRR